MNGASVLLGDECGRLTALTWDFDGEPSSSPGVSRRGPVSVRKSNMGVVSACDPFQRVIHSPYMPSEYASILAHVSWQLPPVLVIVVWRFLPLEPPTACCGSACIVT